MRRLLKFVDRVKKSFLYGHFNQIKLFHSELRIRFLNKSVTYTADLRNRKRHVMFEKSIVTKENPATQLHFCLLNSTFTYSPYKHAYMWQINIGCCDIKRLDMPCVFPVMAQLLPVATMTVKRQMTASDSEAGLEEMPLCHLLFHFPFWMTGWFLGHNCGK